MTLPTYRIQGDPRDRTMRRALVPSARVGQRGFGEVQDFISMRSPLQCDDQWYAGFWPGVRAH